MSEAKLLPCPCCGNEYPFQYISFSCCVLRCKCGIELHGAAISPVYHMETMPEELKQFASPAELLVIRTDKGDVSWPEHGYYSVSVVESFRHFGHLEKWNRRAPAKTPACAVE